MNDLNELSPDSKVWIYQANRALTAQEREHIRDMGERFVADWSAHGSSLKARFDIFYDRFLVFFVDEGKQEATGCSIDRSVHFIKGIESKYDMELMDRKLVAYKEGKEGVSTLPFDQLDKALEEGQLNWNSTVFNNLVRTKKEFEEAWELPLCDSWHARMISVRERPVSSGRG